LLFKKSWNLKPSKKLRFVLKKKKILTYNDSKQLLKQF
jgi:hypothetical protein